MPLEIVVVDQSANPPGGIAELGEGTEVAVRHLRTPTRGLSSARNLGAAEARGTIVAFIDDDVLAEPTWLAAMVAAFDDPHGARVVSGRVLGGEPEVADGFAPAIDGPNFERRVFHGRLPIDVLAGGNMAVDKAIFARLGGFDERLGAGSGFPSAEDNDLGLRLLDAGLGILNLPDATVVHRAWRPGREYPRLRWRYGLGKGGFYAKYARSGDLYGLRRAIRDLRKRLVSAPRGLGRPRYAAGELTYAAGVVAGMLRWLAVRSR